MDKKLSKSVEDNLNRAGRKAGVPNKSTTMAREAIARFVDGNAHKMQEWLEQVADGVKNDEDKFVVLPNPEKAFGMLQSVMEYHLPKLARSEQVGDETAPVRHEHIHKFKE
jgi:hypothetical protein